MLVLTESFLIGFFQRAPKAKFSLRHDENEIYFSSSQETSTGSGLEVIKLFSCSTQLSMKFILLINVKMPTIVGILTFISMINTSERLKARNFFVGILVFMSSSNFVLS